MMRKTLRTRRRTVGKVDVCAKDDAAEYQFSINTGKNFIKPPNWDSGQCTIEKLYLENMLEYNISHKLHREMLEQVDNKSKDDINRIKSMDKMQEKLRKKFIFVNNFIRECGDKKRSAENLIKGEKKIHVELYERISDLKEKVATLTAFRNELKKTVAAVEPYNKILMDVVAKSDIYESTKDCMDRCDALMLTQVEMHNLITLKIHQIDEMRKKMLQTTNEAKLIILGLTNELIAFQHSYSEVCSQLLKWEKILENAKSTIIAHETEKYNTIEGMLWIYRLLCQRNSDVKVEGSFEDLIDSVYNEILFIKQVLQRTEQFS